MYAYNHSCKIVLVGECFVGKTALTQRLAHDLYNEKSNPTIGVDYTTKTFKMNDSNMVKLQIWDTAGQENFLSLIRTYYKDVGGAIIMYDVTKRSTFDKVEFWYNELKNNSGDNYPILLLANNTIQQLNITSVTGTNNKRSMSIIDALNTFSDRIDNVLEPGDVLMFDATTIHRGIFYKKQKHRRLIQLFDCVFDYDYDYYLRTILHVPCRNDCSTNISSILIKLNKNKKFSNLVNYLVYLNTAIGYSKLGNSLFSDEEFEYISTESNQTRINNPIKDKFERNNQYVINIKGVENIKEENRSIFMFISFTINYLIILIVSILLIYILFLLASKIKYII